MKPDASIPFVMPERLARTDPNRAVTEMVGSGPYRFVAGEYNSGSRVVYERFDGYVPRQEPPVWTSGGKGTGLGLFIAECLVRAHGGQIGVDSVPGRGANFHFTLPRHAPTAHRPKLRWRRVPTSLVAPPAW